MPEYSERTERHNLRSRQLRAEIETTMGMRQAVDPLMPPIPPLDQLPFPLLPKKFKTLDGMIVDSMEDIFSQRDGNGEKPTVTLLLTHTNDAARKSLELYRRPFLEEFGNKPKVQTFELSLQSGWLRNCMNSVLANFMKNVVPKDLHDRAALLTGETFPYEQALGMSDRLLGYAYLVDSRGIVWWSARCSKDFDEAMGNRVTEEMRSWTNACLDASTKVK
eukprot:g4225.t1